MATGSTKTLEDQNQLGWFVVNLQSIETNADDADEELLASTREQLSPVLINEYSAQLARAIREEVGVEINDEAVEALRKTLTGES